MFTKEDIKKQWGDIPAEWMEIELEVAILMQQAGSAGLPVDGELWEKQMELLRSNVVSSRAALDLAVPESFKGIRPSDRTMIAKLVYDELKLMKAPKSTGKTAARPVNKDVLSQVKDHPVIKALQFAQHAQSELSFAESAQGFLEIVDGTICSSYDTFKAPTGRIYCSDYNVMQLPHPMREAVKVRTAGNKFFIGDYQAQEFRILISLAKEQKLVDAIEQGRDVHRMAVSAALGIPEDQVTDEQRNKIGKVLNYGLTYGGTAYTVRKAVGLPEAECQLILDNYFRAFTRLKAWQDRVKATAGTGKVTNCFGYTRNFGREIGREGKPENIALNTSIQSAGACFLKRAIVGISKLPSTRVLTCVHDSVLVEFDPKQIEPSAIQKVMEWTPEGWVKMVVEWEVADVWG